MLVQESYSGVGWSGLMGRRNGSKLLHSMAPAINFSFVRLRVGCACHHLRRCAQKSTVSNESEVAMMACAKAGRERDSTCFNSSTDRKKAI